MIKLLDIDDLVIYLKAENILTISDQDRLKVTPSYTHNAAISALADIIKRKGSSGLDRFMSALRRSANEGNQPGHLELLQKLEQSLEQQQGSVHESQEATRKHSTTSTSSIQSNDSTSASVNYHEYGPVTHIHIKAPEVPSTKESEEGRQSMCHISATSEGMSITISTPSPSPGHATKELTFPLDPMGVNGISTSSSSINDEVHSSDSETESPPQTPQSQTGHDDSANPCVPLVKDVDNQPETSPSPSVKDQRDILHELGCSLFDTPFYHIFQRYRNTKLRSVIRYLLAALFVYQFLAMTLVTLCENGGFPALFWNEESTYNELLHRFLMFALRVGCRVLTPLVFMMQFDSLAYRPMIPRTTLTELEALQRLRHVHKVFSPGNELHRLQNCDPSEAFKESANIVKRHINSSWVLIVHSIFFTFLLFRLGAFLMAEERIMHGGVCEFDFLYETRIRLPFVNNPIHLSVLGECLSMFIIVLVVGIVKEAYCYENRIATYAVILGNPEGGELYNNIRNRWYILDWYFYFTPLALFAVAELSFSTGKAFTPEPSHMIEPFHLVSWYFWIFVLSVLTFLATSPNRLTKMNVVFGHAIIIIFIYVVNVEGLTIPATGDCAVILLYTTLAVLNLNLVFTLYRCNRYRYKQTSSTVSGLLMIFCLVCMGLLPIYMFGIVRREVIHFAGFLIRLD